MSIMNQIIEFMNELLPLLILAAVIGLVVARRMLRLRREREKSREHIHDVVVEMGKHGKIRRGRGKYHPHNWAMKWILYSRGIRISTQRYEMSAPELPKLPRPNE
jgi:hypothetical protein